MKVLFAGTPGVNKSVALERLRKACEELYSEQRIYTDEAGAIPILDKRLYGAKAHTFLKKRESLQKTDWRGKFKQVLQEFEGAKREHHFLGLHMALRYRQVPSCVVSFDDLVEWKPDCVVTFIDDVYAVRHRVHKRGHDAFTLAELLLWRVEELLIADILSRILKVPNYFVAVKHPARMLAKVLLGKETRRIYLSHEISDIRNNKTQRAVIDRVCKRLRRLPGCAVFEPLMIDELPLVKRRGFDPRNAEHRWPTLEPEKAMVSDSDLPRKFKQIPRDEVEEAERAINSHIDTRDVRLVRQSEALIVYRPTMSGGRTYTSGVRREIDEAKSGQRVFTYIKKGVDGELRSPMEMQASGEDPDFFYERSETNFWKRVEKFVKESRDRDFDRFLE